MKLTKSSRAFRRATAFVLAAALTLSAPVATNASAASKKVPSLSVKKKTLYYNKAGKKSFTLKVKKNKVKKIVKTKWTTSKKSVAKLSGKKKTKVKVLAKKKGTAKITAKVTYKAGSKTKTKKLVCKVTSKKAKAPVKTKEPVVTPSSTATTTEAPTQAPSEAPSKDPVKTDAPSAEPTATAEPTDAPVDSTATASSITAIEVDGNNFQFSVLLENGKNNEAAVKNAKLELKKDSITATASFKEMDGANSAIFKIDDSKVLTPGDRSADGKYGVTSKSKSLTLAKDAYTTYEEAIDALAVEGFVTTPHIVNNAIDPTKYDPVAGATITLIENGKTVKTDAKGYYKLTTSSGTKTLKVEKDGYIGQITPADNIIVNKSHLTSQNFVLATFDQEKVKVKINVVDSTDDTKKIKDANVQILGADGKVLAGTDTKKTDTRGRSIFANCYAGIANDGTELDTTVVGGNTVPDPAFYDKANDWGNPPKETYFEKGKTYKVKVSKGLSWANLRQNRAGTNDNGVYEENTAEVTIETKHTYEITVRLRPIKELPSLKVTQKFEDGTDEYAKAPDRKTDIAAAETADKAAFKVYTEYELYADYDGNGIADELANYSHGAYLPNEGFIGSETAAKAAADQVHGRFVTKLNTNAETTINILDPDGNGSNSDNLLGFSGKPCLPSGTYYLILRSYTGDATKKADADDLDAANYVTPDNTDYTVAEIKVEEGKDCTVTVSRSEATNVKLTTNLDVDQITKNAQGNTEATPPTLTTGSALMAVHRVSGNYQMFVRDTDKDQRAYTQNTLYRKIGNMLVKVENSETVYPYDVNNTKGADGYSDLTLVYTSEGAFLAHNEYTHLTKKEDYVVRARSNYGEVSDVPVKIKSNMSEDIDLDARFRIESINIKKQDDDALLTKDAAGNDIIRKITKIRVLDSNGKELSVRNYGWWEEVASGTSPVPAKDANAVYNTDALRAELFKPDTDQKVNGKVKIEVTLSGCNPVTSDALDVTDLEYLTVNITEKVTPVTGRTALTGTVTINKKEGGTKTADASANLVQIILYNSQNKIVAFGKTENPVNGVSKYTITQAAAGNSAMAAGDYKLVARGKTAETLVTTVTLKEQESVTKNLVMDEGAQGSAKVVMTDTNLNPISGLKVAAYDENYVRIDLNENWATYSAAAYTNMNQSLFGRYEGADISTEDNNTGTITSATEKQISNLSVGSYTVHFWENGTEFSTVGDNYTHENQSLVLSTNGESKRPEYQFVPVNVAPGGKVRLTVNQTAGLVSRVVFAKPLDADGKELDQIEDIAYVGRATGTYPEQLGMNAGQVNYTVLKVNPHRAYNVYVYDFTGKYVVKQMKNVEGVDAKMTIDYTPSAKD